MYKEVYSQSRPTSVSSQVAAPSTDAVNAPRVPFEGMDGEPTHSDVEGGCLMSEVVTESDS